MSTTFMVSAVGVVAAAVLAAVVMRDGKGEPATEAQEEPAERELAA